LRINEKLRKMRKNGKFDKEQIIRKEGKTLGAKKRLGKT